MEVILGCIGVIMENQMEMYMEHEMDTREYMGLY